MTKAEKRLAAAQRDLRQMKKEIEPFVKERDRRQYTTAGRWRDTRRTDAQRSLERNRAGRPKTSN